MDTLAKFLELKKELKVQAPKILITNCVKLRESVKLSGFDLPNHEKNATLGYRVDQHGFGDLY